MFSPSGHFGTTSGHFGTGMKLILVRMLPRPCFPSAHFSWDGECSLRCIGCADVVQQSLSILKASIQIFRCTSLSCYAPGRALYLGKRSSGSLLSTSPQAYVYLSFSLPQGSSPLLHRHALFLSN